MTVLYIRILTYVQFPSFMIGFFHKKLLIVKNDEIQQIIGNFYNDEIMTFEKK